MDSSREEKKSSEEKTTSGRIVGLLTQRDLHPLPDSQVLSLRIDGYWNNSIEHYPAQVFDFSHLQEEMKPSQQYELPFREPVYFCKKDKNMFCYRRFDPERGESVLQFQFVNKGKIEACDSYPFNFGLLYKDFKQLLTVQRFDNGNYLYGTLLTSRDSVEAFIYNLANDRIYIFDLNEVRPLSACLLTLDNKPKLIIGTNNSQVWTYDLDFSLERKERGQLVKHMIVNENAFNTGKSVVSCEASPDSHYFLTLSQGRTDSMHAWKIHAKEFLQLELLQKVKVTTSSDKSTWPRFAADGSIIFFDAENHLSRAVIVPNQEMQIELLPLSGTPKYLCCLSDGRLLHIDESGSYGLLPASHYLNTYNRIVQQFYYGEVASGLPRFSFDLTSLVASYAAFYPAQKVVTDERTFLRCEIQSLADKITLACDKKALNSLITGLDDKDPRSLETVFADVIKDHGEEVSVECKDFLTRVARLVARAQPGATLDISHR